MTHGPPVGKSYCFYLSVWTNLTVMEYLCHNDHRYVPLVVSISRSFPHSWLFTGFVTRLTRLVPLLEQELLTLPEHLNSPPVFSSIRVTQSLVLYVYFVDRCLYSFFWPLCCLFFCLLAIVLSVLLSFGHCVVCSSSIYGFWLPLWYLQTFLSYKEDYRVLIFCTIFEIYFRNLSLWS